MKSLPAPRATGQAGDQVMRDLFSFSWFFTCPILATSGRRRTGARCTPWRCITVNAGSHPVMKRFHKPNEEKRMVVFLDPSEYLDWLACPVHDAKRFFRPVARSA